jgi:hypothetical protein
MVLKEMIIFSLLKQPVTQHPHLGLTLKKEHNCTLLSSGNSWAVIGLILHALSPVYRGTNVKFTLEQATKARRESRVIAVLFL